MHITITLTEAEKQGIKKYLEEVDEPTTDESIENEVRTRLYHALRDPREAISDHILSEEKQVLAAYDKA